MSVSTGPIGLVCLLVAKAMGASKVIISGNAKFPNFPKTMTLSRCLLIPRHILLPLLPLIQCADLSPERLAMAKELGADFQLQVKREDEAKQLAKSVGDKLGVQPHVAIECTGAESCIQTAIYVSVVIHI